MQEKTRKNSFQARDFKTLEGFLATDLGKETAEQLQDVFESVDCFQNRVILLHEMLQRASSALNGDPVMSELVVLARNLNGHMKTIKRLYRPALERFVLKIDEIERKVR